MQSSTERMFLLLRYMLILGPLAEQMLDFQLHDGLPVQKYWPTFPNVVSCCKRGRKADASAKSTLALILLNSRFDMAGGPRLQYIYRPVLLGGCAAATGGGNDDSAEQCFDLGAGDNLQLPGFGVEMVIKNMEYSALDDKKVTSPQRAAASAAWQLCCILAVLKRTTDHMSGAATVIVFPTATLTKQIRHSTAIWISTPKLFLQVSIFDVFCKRQKNQLGREMRSYQHTCRYSCVWMIDAQQSETDSRDHSRKLGGRLRRRRRQVARRSCLTRT